jgi:hypothetical protein
LVLGDGNHYSFDPPVISKKITITVKGEDDDERVSERSKHRQHHRIHPTHFANARKDRQPVEPKPTNGSQEGCPFHGLWGILKGCQEAASSPVKPEADSAPAKPPVRSE